MEGVTNLRIIHDLPAAGDWNMAVDEMMLETVAASGESILRFYQWEQPTLSLGYFQTLEDRRSHPASLNCPVVRRSTGGGAIMHDHELTYSIAMPLADRWSPAAVELYDAVHGALVAALGKLGLAATLCLATDPGLHEEFLCFRRRATGDVLVAGHKIAGSAQRRRQGALLQHGSVILAGSACAPEIRGMSELGLVVCSASLASHWTEQMQQCWRDTAFQPSGWSADEHQRVSGIQAARFSSHAWLSRRSVEYPPAANGL
jgi:lipoate-protein ligase A